MRVERRKVSAVYNDFILALDRLSTMDERNQTAFSSGTPGNANRLTRSQLHHLTESIFFASYRAYEGFLGDVFQLYCLGKPMRSGKMVRSYLNPRDFGHAGVLIQSSLKFLDWTSPDIVIQRAESYLRDGFPVKDAYTANKVTLQTLKRLRNHIAHDSKESLAEYLKVLGAHFSTLPIDLPSPGEFLLLQNRADKTKYNLQAYLEFLRVIADQLA